MVSPHGVKRVLWFKRGGGLVLVGLLWAWSTPAWACGACRGAAGAGASLTAPWETWGAALLYLHQPIHGAWDQARKYTQEEHRARKLSELTLGVAWRPVMRAELAFSLPYVYENTSPSDQAYGLGDAVARVRWEAVAEPAFLSGQAGELNPWPSLGLSLSVRMPTGEKSASPASPGLGTWEGALAMDTRYTFWGAWQLALVGEGALRLPHLYEGKRRALGPRGLVRASLLYLPSTESMAYTMGLMADTWWEGASVFGESEGRSKDRGGVGFLGGVKWLRTGLRSSLFLMANPPWDGMGRAMLGMYTLGVSVGYAH